MKKTYLILLTAVILLTAGCYKQKDFDKVNIDPNTVILDFKVLKDSLLANGTDTTTISAELPLAAKDSMVTFSATSGIFVETSKNTAAVKSVIHRVGGLQKRLASVTYQAGNTAGGAVLSAQVNDYIKTHNLKVLNNYATALKITPSALSLKADPFAEMTFTVNLSSANGTVSAGQAVSLTVRDAANTDRGSFRVKRGVSDASGSCTYTYNIMPDTAYRGKLTVTAQATANNKLLTDATTIYIIK